MFKVFLINLWNVSIDFLNGNFDLEGFGHPKHQWCKNFWTQKSATSVYQQKSIEVDGLAGVDTFGQGISSFQWIKMPEGKGLSFVFFLPLNNSARDFITKKTFWVYLQALTSNLS